MEIKNKTLITGKVIVELFRDGKLIDYRENHNIVTDEGDALIADILAESPARTKFDNTNAKIEVGTGWTGTTPKQNTSCNTSSAVEAMDASYPQLKGSWGNANDNVIVYKATFEAGDINATSPAIDEVAILNNATPASADCLAYAQITPEIPVASTDTLAVTWEITLLGA